MSKIFHEVPRRRPIAKLLLTLWRRITPWNLLLTGGWKMMWLRKKQG